MPPFPLQPVPATSRRVLICVNPHAGAQRRERKVLLLAENMRAKGLEPSLEHNLDTATEIARAWQASGELRVVVAAGGDGTISELANRMPSETPLCPFPLGTENLVAKHLGLFGSVEAVAQAVSAGRFVRFDAGELNGRLFLVMASCGFDAEVIRRIARARRGNITHGSYLKPIWEAMLSYEYSEIRMHVRRGEERDPCASADSPIDLRAAEGAVYRAPWVFAFNLPRYALGLGLAPKADGCDGWLDVRLLKGGSNLSGLRYFAAALFGSIERRSDVASLRIAEAWLESDRPVPVQIDGDYACELPAVIRVLPRRVVLLVGPPWLDRHGAALKLGEEAATCP